MTKLLLSIRIGPEAAGSACGGGIDSGSERVPEISKGILVWESVSVKWT